MVGGGGFLSKGENDVAVNKDGRPFTHSETHTNHPRSRLREELMINKNTQRSPFLLLKLPFFAHNH